MTMSMNSNGYNNETLAYNQINAGSINVMAEAINTDIEQRQVQKNLGLFHTITETVTDDSKVRPLLNQMNLSNQANYKLILLQNKNRDESYTGLNETGAIIVAITITVATGWVGARVAAAMTTAAASTAAIIGSISAINSGLNGGNLFDMAGSGIDSVVSKEGVKSVATSAVIVGLMEWTSNQITTKPTYEKGTDYAVYKPSEDLVNSQAFKDLYPKSYNKPYNNNIHSKRMNCGLSSLC